ncbi:SGNH hydrolase-type esterase domain-containing protein [Dioszegia hungarica]|uniref:SGNH hydrolase-type esterase domain-containing protein n=1 Tax=Dioszegia hungarica TaxID=4972 RepID=A0AA38H9R9_9TREE|nr:SGNH hydrolase-type esterase domain-containing protein [Dioszegia hungarica]KAI9635171.1 SGNH hydrolase-type esterase domain-containing protein [Dioszegia hungarica]
MLRLISLGSSFAAGPGLQPIVNKPANRSSVNYPSLLSSLLSADEHIDLSYSGATLLNILNTPQDAAPPQIEAITAAKNDGRCIVTITAGGNDLGYVGGLMLDSLWGSWLGWPLAYLASRRIKSEVIGEEELVNRFKEVVRAVRTKIPKAEVILVGYLTLVGEDIQPGVNVPLTAEQVATGRMKAEILRRAYKRAAEEEGCEFVDVAEESKEHGVGSAEPWVSGHTWSMLWGGEVGWHPNKKGMEAVAWMVHRHIQSRESS